jgi:hypothetical protein
LHTPAASQASLAVHALPSSHEVPAAFGDGSGQPVAGSQVPGSSQGFRLAHATEFFPVHAPIPSHALAWVHALPSLHGVPTGLLGFEQRPVIGSHAPALWHSPSASQTRGVVPAQEPL